MHGLQPQPRWRTARTRDCPRAAAQAHGIACDQELAGRIRRLIGSDPGLTEKKMSGGLAFLIRGNMAIVASSQGGAMVRAGPRQSAALAVAPAARVMEMRGRPMRAGCMSAPLTCAPTTISPPGPAGAPGTCGRCRQSSSCGPGAVRRAEPAVERQPERETTTSRTT